MSERPFRVWFWHNHVKRHWCNFWFWFRFRGEWKRRDLPMPRAGAISQEAWDWASSEAAKIDYSRPQLGRPLSELRAKVEAERAKK